MAKLPERVNRTVAAIRARHERDAEDWRRPHLGASLIGRECVRFLWYTFRWANPPGFDGRMLRLFDRGQREEEWIIQELKALEWEVYAVDENGNQYRVSYHGGHFSGSCDGVVRGVPEALKTWHLAEIKTSNDKRFQELRKNGVAKAHPEHYAQMQVYMHGLKLKRALYLCVNKNDDTIYVERVKYDREFAERVIAKAHAVVFAAEPLTRVSTDPTWWKCKTCQFRPTCHLGDPSKLERNCRTCASSTPESDGQWWCEFHHKHLTADMQRAGCDAHLFIPALLPWQPVDFDESSRAVTYRAGNGVVVIDHGRELDLPL